MPYETASFPVDHPCEPVQPMTYDNDWLVENFTPKLREFVLEHFQEDMSAFISLWATYLHYVSCPGMATKDNTN